MLHEIFHRIDPNIRDDNRVYGIAAAEQRARESAVRAKTTAANYQYYAEDVTYTIP